jgi:hypothetical protein
VVCFQIVVAFGTQLPVTFLTSLFDPESLLLTARLSHYQEVGKRLRHFYRKTNLLFSGGGGGGGDVCVCVSVC